MGSYTITIAPNDESGASTTLIVDTSGGQVLITDVHLHAAGGLTGGHLPTLDFGLLLRAIATPQTGPAEIEPTADIAPTAAAATPPPAVDDAGAGEEEPVPTAATAPKPRRAKRTPAADPTPEPAVRPRARRTNAASTARAAAKAKATGAKRAGAKATARKKQATKTTAPAGREYRRMPEDFGVVYRKANTAAAIADHYEVPRHTAQGWIRRAKATTNTAASSS